jgi:two-component system, NtrC family, response regulator AtoC
MLPAQGPPAVFRSSTPDCLRSESSFAHRVKAPVVLTLRYMSIWATSEENATGPQSAGGTFSDRSPERTHLEKPVLQVSFLSQDSRLGDVIGRALGDGFVLRCFGAPLLTQMQEILNWSDVIFVDLRQENSEDGERLGIVDQIKKIPLRPPIIALCDCEDRAHILAAIELGANDSITNPPDILELRLLLRRAHRFFAAERELRRLRSEQTHGRKLHDLLGTSPAMQELSNLAGRIASCDVNVLITGETGTGKELLARAIHQMGSRSGGPLVAFSCANLPETLVEDELFGHEKGAFTGAFLNRQGRVESANHGSLFLDEVGDLPIALQPKLLRVLQERNFERLGSNRTINVDIRIISATNHNLADLVKQGKFREDLYYRLNVVELHLPPLRERTDDVSLLAHHFLHKSAQHFRKNARRFSQAALSSLEQYSWPGNVRELENIIQRAVVLSDGPTIECSNLPPAFRSLAQKPVADAESLAVGKASTYEEEIKRFKRNLVVRTLRECGWRKAESARALGVARGYLHRLINQLDIREDQGQSLPEQSDVPFGTVM